MSEDRGMTPVRIPAFFRHAALKIMFSFLKTILIFEIIRVSFKAYDFFQFEIHTHTHIFLVENLENKKKKKILFF